MLKISYSGFLGLSSAVRRNSLLKCAPQPKVQKITKIPYLGSLGRSTSSTWYPQKAH